MTGQRLEKERERSTQPYLSGSQAPERRVTPVKPYPLNRHLRRNGILGLPPQENTTLGTPRSLTTWSRLFLYSENLGLCRGIFPPYHLLLAIAVTTPTGQRAVWVVQVRMVGPVSLALQLRLSGYCRKKWRDVD